MDLHDAIKQQNTMEVRSAIGAGDDVTAPDKDGYSPLYMAAVMGDMEIVGLLKKAGAGTDIFIEAALGNEVYVCDAIAAGADVNAANSHGHQALMPICATSRT